MALFNSTFLKLGMTPWLLTKNEELMFQDYWCLQLWKYIKYFFGSCDVCNEQKILLVLTWNFWTIINPCIIIRVNIFMDFITYLPPFNSFNFILVVVVVDFLTKMVHYIPYTKEKLEK
jgi:hypothetical protein